MKLELKHLAPYLPYSLICKIKNSNELDTLRAIYNDPEIPECTFYNIIEIQQQLEYIKPILRPLSDLAKEIEVNGEKFVPIEWLSENYFPLPIYDQCKQLIEDSRWIYHVEYLLIQHLLEWHFDVFGLIENDLAIDINTL